jgi:hypothetical protein
MKAKIDSLIKKWNIELAYKNGQEGLAVTGKPMHQHTGDEICILELTDGRFISDADIAPEEVA